MRNKYILLRHGETKYQAEDLPIFYPFPENPPIGLTTKGKKMIKDAVLEIKKENDIDIIYASPFYRTTQSANIASDILRVKPKYDKRLIDINFGIYHGKPFNELWNKISERELFYKKPEKGETRRNVKKRVLSFFKEIDKKHKDKTILIISHADPIWLLVSHLKGLTEEQTIKHKKDYHPKVGTFVKL